MAEPTSPDDDTTASSARRSSEPEMLQPPTEEELAETGEPTAAEIHAAAADSDDEALAAGEREPDADAAEEEVRPAGRAVAADRVAPAEPEVQPERAETAEPARAEAPPPAPVQEQPVIAPAGDLTPLPPAPKSNRLVATMWVLLAAGLFQVLFFGINALVALTFGGGSAPLQQVQSIAKTALAWLPVLLVFLLFELVVLLLNRAGRWAYVLMSLIVGIVVYVATVLLYLTIVLHTVGDTNTLAQTFLNWEFILVGLVAREVMLWTGLAIGSRGIRLRNRHREAREQYDREVADARA